MSPRPTRSTPSTLSSRASPSWEPAARSVAMASSQSSRIAIQGGWHQGRGEAAETRARSTVGGSDGMSPPPSYVRRARPGCRQPPRGCTRASSGAAGGDGSDVFVDFGQREPPELDRARALARVVRGLGRNAQDLEPGQAGRGRRRRNAVPEIDRTFGLTRRVGMGVDRGRGPQAAIDATSASGRRPAANQWWASRSASREACHRGRPRTARSRLPRGASVARPGAARSQRPRRAGHGGTGRCRTARRRRGPGGGSSPGSRRRAHRRRSVTSARSESSVRWPATRQPENAPGLVREAGEPSQEDVAQRARQARRVAVGAARPRPAPR